MSKPSRNVHPSPVSVVGARMVLADEVDPLTLLRAAKTVADAAPMLAMELQAKARQAFAIRWALRKAVTGELAPDVHGED